MGMVAQASDIELQAIDLSVEQNIVLELRELRALKVRTLAIVMRRMVGVWKERRFELLARGGGKDRAIGRVITAGGAEEALSISLGEVEGSDELVFALRGGSEAGVVALAINLEQ